MSVDERQIIKVAQASRESSGSSHQQHNPRTPPSSGAAYASGEHPTSHANSGILSFEYVKEKVTQMMRHSDEKCDTPQQEAERRAAAVEEAIRGSLPPHSSSSRSSTPAQHYENMEEKRKRAEAASIDARPPSRPRSGTNAGSARLDGRPEDVADSPQSGGEMVIDENPRHVDSHGEMDKHKGGSYQPYPQQYSQYNRHNRHVSPAVVSSSHAIPTAVSSSHAVILSSGPPLPHHSTTWTTPSAPSPAQQRSTPNYEPSVEPVSDDDE